MCFYHEYTESITRAEAMLRIAALGAMPIMPSIAAAPIATEANAKRAYTAIVETTALLGNDLTPQPDATILIRGNVIEAAGPASAVRVPDSAFVIAGKGTYTIPGLIDSHVHYFQSGGLYTRPDVIDFRSVRPYTDELQWIKDNLNDTFARYLRAGITSTVDVGGPFWNYNVRDIANATLVAPRVMAAGPLISSVSREILDPNNDPPIVKIDTIEAAKALIDREIASKTDYVKFWWVVLPDKPAKDFEPIARAAIDYAHQRGARVAIHALELETARLAVESGTDILVHSVFDTDVDDAFLTLLESRKVIYCPTLIVLGNYGYTFAAAPNLSAYDLRVANPDVVGTLYNMQDVESVLAPALLARIKKARVPEPPHAAMRNLKRVYDAGITVAAGTDAGNIGTQHASSLHGEALEMVASGLTPKEVLLTMTRGGAAMMGRSHDLGTIETGKLADLVVLGENPVADIAAIASTRWTIKDGHAFEATAILNETPEQVVQRQVNAYNRHDAGVFAESYANDALIQAAFVPEPLRSRRKIAAFYGDLFAKYPNVRVEILSRQIKGDVVVDEERVTLDGTETRHGVVEYHVKNGLITRAEIA